MRLSPFGDGPDRCLKEINYPRSFSPSLSSVVRFLSVFAGPTSVRVSPQRTLPFSSCLLLRPLSRLRTKQKRTVTSWMTTYNTFNPQNIVDELLYTPGQFYTESTHRILRNRAQVPSGHSTQPSESLILPLPRIHPLENGDLDKVIQIPIHGCIKD